MGKRSNFPRVPRDFYPTPFKAVPPLVPHLRGVRRFAEPCCGDGALVRHLESFGLRCVYAGDISSGQDALARDHYGAADAIITNPPWRRRGCCWTRTGRKPARRRRSCPTARTSWRSAA